jgi:ATP-dependent Clp protease ATP-binding subunit ClpX
MAKHGLEGDWKDYILADDLVAYGMERQLMGRFPVRVVYDQLTVQDLKAIMINSEDSPLRAYVNDLKTWGIDLTFTDDALTEVAQRAEHEGTGARGLISILHRVLFEDMYQLPGTYTGEVVLDKTYLLERLR